MNILQWNITSLKTNFCDLKLLLKDENPACVCLQETRHGDQQLNPPSGYRILLSPKKRDDGHERGTALLINKNTNFKKLQLNTNLQAVAAKVWLNKWYTVCSLYLPHINVSEAEIVNLIDQLPKPFLLLGDMNARHSLWGEPIDNEKGKLFERLLSHQDISLLNSDNPTHFQVQTGTYTTIDLSICSDDCLLDFTHDVKTNLHGSDHYPMLIRKIPPPELDEPSYRFKTEKANWLKFKDLTNNYTPPDTNNVDELVDHLNTFIISAAKESIPISEGTNGKIPVPWWNDECRDALRQRNTAERAMKRNLTVANKIAYKRNRANCRKTFNKAKKDSWMRYVSSINENTNMRKIWKRIKKIKGMYTKIPLPLLHNSQNNLTDNPMETSKIFCEAFASVSSLEGATREYKTYKARSEKKRINFDSVADEVYNDLFSYQELITALSQTGETAPGYDKITFSMMKNLHETLKNYLLNLYNRVFIGNLFPSTWRIATIIPLPKLGKDHSWPLNYRPISLTSCLCKILEKMVNGRLAWYLEKGNHLNKIQSGFRQNRSTTDSIVQFTCDVEGAIAAKDHTIAVFFDLRKAYDTAWRYGILRKLYDVGLRGALPKFVKNFLEHRKIRVRVKNTYSDLVEITEGVPQGSVLSCTLFALAINDVINDLPTGVKATLYVDDLTIYFSGRTTRAIERRLQQTMNKLQEWSDRTGFCFSEAKTVAMHICRRRKCEKTAHISLHNTPIICKESHMYLGVKLDSSLTWTPHVTHLKKECYNRMKLIKHLSHTSWGADAKSLTRLYQSLIKSKLEYGYEAYGSCSLTNLKKLEPVQNTAMRIASGAFKTSPIKSLQVITGLMPMEQARDLKMVKYILRVAVNDKNPVHEIINSCGLFEADNAEEEDNFFKTGFLRRAKIITGKFEVDLSTLAAEGPANSPPWRISNLTVCNDMGGYTKSKVPPHIMKTIFQHHLGSHRDNLLLYTDGSKTQEGVAFSVTGGGSEYSYKLNRNASIFTAELNGIKEAITRHLGTQKETITILTDSKSSVQAISKIYSRHFIVQQIQEIIKSSSKSFALCWVPSHTGVEGNERADTLARAAIESADTLPHLMTRDDIVASCKATAKKIWADSWRELQSNKLREITEHISTLPNASCRNRHWERTLARLRIGHTRLTHGYLMEGAEQPKCELCDADSNLTVKHLLIECSHWANQRILHFHRTYGLTIRQVLGDGDVTFEGALYKFILSTNQMNNL